MIQLGQVGLHVRDVTGWRKFATVLGFEVSDSATDGSLYLRMDERHHRFRLIPGERDAVAYLGWEVATAQAFTDAVGKLTAAKVEVTPGTQTQAKARQVLEFAAFKDPNGFQGELYYGPLIEERPFLPTRPISGFVTGIHGLGHAFLGVNNLAETAAFYRDGLGFRVRDYITSTEFNLDMVFMYVNPRHHSLALAYGPPVPPGTVGHIMVETKALEDVGRAYDLCAEQNIPVGLSLGQHTNDRMVSFYVVTPSGFWIEYGFGGLLVTDEASWVVQRHVAAHFWGHKPAAPAGAH